METNKRKSRVMNFRLPKDRPKTDPVINGFPSVQEYQYLGVVLTDMMVLDADKKKEKQNCQADGEENEERCLRD